MSAAQIELALQENQRERAAATASRQAFDRVRNQQVASIRDMQQQQADAAARAREAASYSLTPAQTVPAGQLPPRRYEPYPGMLGGYRGWYGPGWGFGVGNLVELGHP